MSKAASCHVSGYSAHTSRGVRIGAKQQRVTALVAHECQAMREARDGRSYQRREECGVVDESEAEEDGETTDGQDKEGLTAVLKA